MADAAAVSVVRSRRAALGADLPDVDGFSLGRWIRGPHRQIIVTARDAAPDAAIDLGTRRPGGPRVEAT